MSSVILYRIDASKHMHRFYRLDVQQDLFGQWCVIRELGRIGTTGRERSIPFPSPGAAAALEKQRRIKQCRGYAICFNNQLAQRAGTMR